MRRKYFTMGLLKLVFVGIIGLILGVIFAPQIHRVADVIKAKMLGASQVTKVNVLDDQGNKDSKLITNFSNESEESTTNTIKFKSDTIESIALPLPGGVPTNVMIINQGEVTKHVITDKTLAPVAPAAIPEEKELAPTRECYVEDKAVPCEELDEDIIGHDLEEKVNE